MRNRILVVCVLALVSIALGASMAYAVDPHAVYLPAVFNGTGADLVKLVGGDNTEVSAAVAPAGCTFLAYIDRDGGNLLHVVRDDGDHVTEVAEPIIVEGVSAAPAFVPPGEKHASSALLIAGGRLILYYTARPDGATSGPFSLWRLSMPIPPCAGAP